MSSGWGRQVSVQVLYKASPGVAFTLPVTDQCGLRHCLAYHPVTARNHMKGAAMVRPISGGFKILFIYYMIMELAPANHRPATF